MTMPVSLPSLQHASLHSFGMQRVNKSDSGCQTMSSNLTETPQLLPKLQIR